MGAMLLVLAWIAAGLCTVQWLWHRQGAHTDTLFLVFLLVYFGAPLLLVGLVNGEGR